MKLFELQSSDELNKLESYLDQLMMPVGLDVEFTKHFIERLVGREKEISIEEITTAFTKLKRKYKKRLLRKQKRKRTPKKLSMTK